MLKVEKVFVKCAFALAVAMMFMVGNAYAESAKYVFLFIGDGMGLPQRAATAAYTGKKLAIDSMPAQGVTTTFANDRFITGSAASATALATGVKTNINYIGMDPDFKPVKNLAEMAKEQGKKVGIVSSVSIDHATPAAFYAHVKTRKMYHEIDCALAESGFDFFAGGGMVDPTGKKSKAPLGDALEKAKANGYRIVSDKKEFMALKPGDGKVLAWNAWLQDAQALPYSMDMTDKDITLPEFTGKAIEMLDNDKGFFLMVEGGKIDWACHANDAAASILNTIAFDQAAQKALDFYKKHPNDTLIVVTGDHECGGLTLGFAGTQYGSNYEVLGNQKISFQKFTDEVMADFRKSGGDFEAMKPVITKNFGLKFAGDPKKDILVLADYQIDELKTAFARSMKAEAKAEGAEYLLYGDYDPLSVTLTHLLNQKAGLAWTSYKHTGVPVSTSAIGVGSEQFNGYYDNVDIATKIMSSMGLQAQPQYVESGKVRIAAN
ncbi:MULTISPECIES: alkaline phosphatase [unclassified Pseudodesulfovibrio]|uniref:alkaline phosphatase n=1 Tax=unclassified Pseudodesulfovibrio TaxID=2661612 RepID=UPI000FEBE016|nr:MULTISPECIES: alkaline phosphatase [unclassified Pseudodesulfovibrio]MCJ2164847.1 alkaline phosphatase [Pseudodesulfovibrio sp. S3-i]RWU03785.1 alkaline phosphatase [Pseudodesulfovibrio sp. S3]